MEEASNALCDDGEALFKKGMALMRQLEQAAAIRCIERAADVFNVPSACAELSFLIQLEVGFARPAAVKIEMEASCVAPATSMTTTTTTTNKVTAPTDVLATRAFDLAMRAHAGGCAAGSAAVARCLRLGVGTEADIDAAFDLASAANAKNSAYGAWQLALCFHHGAGVLQDERRAFELYERATVLNDGGVGWV